MDIKEQELNATPGYYQNPSGLPYIKRTSAGAIGSKVDRLVKVLKHTSTNTSLNSTINLKHGLGKVHQYFCRYRYDGDNAWQMFPTVIKSTFSSSGLEQVTISSIDRNNLVILFNTVPTKTTVHFEIYFTEFAID